MKKNKILINIGLIVLCVVFTYLVKNLDVKGIAPYGNKVGFAFINNAFHKMIGYNSGLYNLSEKAGYIPFIMIGVYALVGALQLYKRKSLLKVDKELLALAGFYVIVLCVYLFFEKVVINYRPVLMNGKLEASYPSSHTLLALCVCGSSILINKFLFSRIIAAKIENMIAYGLAFVILFSRLLSGVHWLTDIIGGVIISATLLFTYYVVLCKIKETKNKKSEI